MSEKKQKVIDDKKMDDFIKKNWTEYQKAQSKKTSSSKPTKKTVKRK